MISKPVLAAVCAAVALGVGAGYRHQTAVTAPKHNATASQQTVVRVLTGSAKSPIFENEEIKNLLAAKGLHVVVETTKGPSDIERFAAKGEALPALIWPAGANATQAFLSGVPALKNAAATPVFYTELVLATWTPVVKTLLEAGAVQMDSSGQPILDLAKFLDLAQTAKWNTLPRVKESKNFPGVQRYAPAKSIYVATPSLASNTTLLFYGLTATALNNNEPVSTESRMRELSGPLKAIARKQGFTEDNLTGPFEDYRFIGSGKVPIALVYENQFKAVRAELPSEAVLMRMSPTLIIKHSAIPTSDAGRTILQVLQSTEAKAILSRKLGYSLTPAALPAQIITDEPANAILEVLREEFARND